MQSGASAPTNISNHDVEYLEPTVVLTDTASAPRLLRLRYGVCLACRAAVSRCDGHDNYTKTCIQCDKKNIPCTWACVSGLTESEGPVSQSNYVDQIQRELSKSRTASVLSVDDSAEEDSAEGNQNDFGNRRALQGPPLATSSATLLTSDPDVSRQATRLRQNFRFPLNDAEDKGLSKKPDVPPAGWPDAPLNEEIKSSSVSLAASNFKGRGRNKGKGKAVRTPTAQTAPLADSDVDEAIPGQENPDDFHERQNTFELDQGLSGQLLRQLGLSANGLEFRDLSSYRSLMSSQFAEESSDLAKSLYWWEFSRDAKDKVKYRFPSSSQLGSEQWAQMGYFEKLLAENALAWDLWPRKLYTDQPSLTSGEATKAGSTSDSLHQHHHSELFRSPVNAPFMLEQLINLVQTILNRSSLPDHIQQNTHPMHIQALAHAERNFGYPASLRSTRDWRYTAFHKSRFAIPATNVEAFGQRYLDRDELVLDIVDRIASRASHAIKHTLDSVLLKVAQLRQPKGARRPPSTKAYAVDLEAEVQEGASSSRKKRKTDDVAEQTGRKHSRTSTIVDQASDYEDNSKRTKRRRKRDKAKHEAPVNWKGVLHAAIHIPGMPRR